MSEPTFTYKSDPHDSILGSRHGAPGQPPTMGGESERADGDDMDGSLDSPGEGCSAACAARPTIRGVNDAHGGYIASIVRRVLGAHRRAEVSDVVNLSLVEINKGLPKFEPARGTSLRVWMYPIVVRTARRYAQKGRSLASRMVHLEDLEGTVLTDDVMTNLMSGDELRRLWNELTARLPAKQRVLLQLHVLSGLSSREIADLKGWNKNTTRGDLTDAKRALETLHRQWQEAQERAGASVLPLAFAFWSAHVQETAQYVPASMRAALLATVEKLEAVGPGAGLDHARPGRGRLEARVLRPVLASTSTSSNAMVGGGLAGALILAATMLVMVLLALAALALRARVSSAGTTTSTAASALVATASAASAAAPVAAPAPVPSPASPPPSATASTSPAPVPADVAAPVAPDTHRAAIMQAFTRALREHRHNEACAALHDYDGHGFGAAGAADRARMARLVVCDPK